MPDSFSIELRSLLTGLLQRDVHKRLGCRGRGADELKSHPFFRGIDWRVVYLQRLSPPLIPARGEVNAADAFDIGSFDDEDTKHIKLTEADQELYRNFPVVVSERWQHEIAETIFDYINHEADKAEMKRKNKNKLGYREEEQSDCILHGYVKRLGGTFTATWLTRYVRLYPNRLELWSDSGKQPELIFMDQIEDVCNDFVLIKNEQCIVIKLYNHSKYVLTNSDEIGLKEWHLSLKAAHRESMDMMTTMAEKATKIYGTEIPLKHMGKRRQQLQQEAGGPGAPSGPFAGLGSMSSSSPSNWEQKIIQKELQASTTGSGGASNKPTNLPNSTSQQAASSPAGPALEKNLAEKTQPTSNKEASGANPATDGHQHHHHHHHNHQKSVDSGGQPAAAPSRDSSSSVPPSGQTTTRHHRAQHHSGHRAHHYHRHHHHHHHEQPSATSGGPQVTVTSGSSSHHHHHHHGHHHHRSIDKQHSMGQRRIRPVDSKQASLDQTSSSTVKELERQANDKQPDLAQAASEIQTPARAAAAAAAAACKQEHQLAKTETRTSAEVKKEAEMRKSGDWKDETKKGLARTTTEEQDNLLSSSSSVASGSASESSESSCSSVSEEAVEEAAPATSAHDVKATKATDKTANEPLKLAVSLENVSDQQEVLKDPSKRITSDNKQREQDLVAQYEKLNVNSRNSSSSIENEEQRVGS